MADGHPPEGCTVLVVADSLRDNGGLRVALAYASRWRRLGAPTQVAVVQDVDDSALATTDPDVPLTFLTARNSRFRYTWPLALGRLLRRARRSDVVLAGSETGIGLVLAFVAARLARRPFAVLVQADLDDSISTWVRPQMQPFTRFVHSRADAAVAVAESIVPGILANGLPPDRVTVVVNGIDVDQVREHAGLSGDAAARPPRSEPPSVVAQGRLSVQKDYPLLIRAHARVLAAGVDHRLVIIGDGPARAELAALVCELGVAGSVELAGYVENPYPISSTADLFVLSSYSEGMPLTILEALAMGLPIVATRCGSGVEQLLQGGAFGELVPVGDVDALGAAIERHLREPADLLDRAVRGPLHARSYDMTRSARTILELLGGLPRTGPGP